MTAVFADVQPAGCICTSRCEHPCVHRIGVSTTPCCKGCAPLPPIEGPPCDCANAELGHTTDCTGGW